MRNHEKHEPGPGQAELASASVRHLPGPICQGCPRFVPRATPSPHFDINASIDITRARPSRTRLGQCQASPGSNLSGMCPVCAPRSYPPSPLFDINESIDITRARQSGASYSRCQEPRRAESVRNVPGLHPENAHPPTPLPLWITMWYKLHFCIVSKRLTSIATLKNVPHREKSHFAVLF